MIWTRTVPDALVAFALEQPPLPHARTGLLK